MKPMLLILVLFSVFLLPGCEAILNFNLFAAIDTPETPSAGAFDAMIDTELLSSVTQLIETESFFAEMAEDDDIKAAVVENLAEIFESGSTADLADQQQASILVAEIELNTTAAGDVVDGFVNVMTEFLQEPADSGDYEGIAETLVTEAFAGVTADTFDETLAALLAAGEAYTFYGESLDDSGEVVAPEEVNSEAIAQGAIVAIIISDIVDTDGDQPGLLSEEELRAVVVDGAPFPEDFTVESSPLEDNEALENIMIASDLEDLFPE